jgi:hypothetical protein
MPLTETQGKTKQPRNGWRPNRAPDNAKDDKSQRIGNYNQKTN